MSDVERRFHEEWLGLVQPSEGLVVSVPVLIEAQVMARQERSVQEKLRSLSVECHAPSGGPDRCAPDVARLLEELLGWGPDVLDPSEALPKPLRLYVPEGKQHIEPSWALRRRHATAPPPAGEADVLAAAQAGRDYLVLVWQVPPEVDLDRPETLTGPWNYSAQAKFDRLLRECRVPVGVLTNGREFRLVYAPHGESSGWLSFRLKDMVTPSGRPILDAFVLLLGRTRLFGVAEEQQLPALLEKSRKQQVGVTNELASQVFQALEELLAGFASASERDTKDVLRHALEQEGHVYSGLLTLLLRLVFSLYCEDRGLLPVEEELFAENYSVLGLFDELTRDHDKNPDSMDRRYGAYPRLLALFRAIWSGVEHGDLHMPPRRGALFDPNEYPFLEGWEQGGSAPLAPEAAAQIQVPALSDGTIYRVLKNLILLDGQRLSYRALDVEQIGSVYEALMGFDVERVVSGAVRFRLGTKKGAARVWVEAAALFERPAARRAAYLQDELGFDKKLAQTLAGVVAKTQSAAEALDALEAHAGKSAERVGPGALVIQPGPERRRTSSHYTPRSLSEPIVRKTLEPVLRAMGERPSSEALLSLVVCDPAMGSGAFLVEACRFLADHLVAAWTRENEFDRIASTHDDVLNYARRLVAQRCLYGVDKNKYAVQLARLSLWLITMAKDEPFTFVDHALRHGDSLVGLDFERIRTFHWSLESAAKGKKKPKKAVAVEQLDTISITLERALGEAIDLRKRILALASDSSPESIKERERLLIDAADATERVRLIADVLVGAFFAHDKDKDREKERVRRLDLVRAWLLEPDLSRQAERKQELFELQEELRRTQVPFHWMLEFPEVFYLERPDPLDEGRVNGAAFVEAVVGNPPFLGGSSVSSSFGEAYRNWLPSIHPGAHGNADLSAHFFRRASALLGDHGAIGLIATNTIGQGDTRWTGLQHLVQHDFSISSAAVNLPWPGDAAVTVSVVHLVRGRPRSQIIPELDGRRVEMINSQLRAGQERSDPQPLLTNASASFLGSKIYGQGFVLTPEEREVLIARHTRNSERIFAYLGGEEVNTSPTQSHDRYVISFDQMPLEEAERWPDIIKIVREKVKPERDKLREDTGPGKHGKKYWWQFQHPRVPLYAAIAPLERCLVSSRVTKHLCFAFQPTNRVFSEAINVFPLSNNTPFAVLQSRIHEVWARLLSSTMEDRLRYSASDCFETFPFPVADPHAVVSELEELGERLYSARARYMVDTNQGLTKTYNALKDPSVTDPRILELRALHEELDRAVLRAYPRLAGVGQPTEPKLAGVGSKEPGVVGWNDIPVPPYCPATDEDRATLQAFEDQVLDRLFVLNSDRAQLEAGAGKVPHPVEKKAKSESTASPAASGRKKRDPAEGSGQGKLF